jgi:predicted ATPase
MRQRQRIVTSDHFSANFARQAPRMAWKQRATRLPAPYLKRVAIDPARVADWDKYPFNLPLFAAHAFELCFDRPVTIIVGENGIGKSTLLEGVAVLAGFDEAGGGNGYRPVDHSRAVDRSGGALAKTFKAQWLPKVTSGWFFRAESFFSVARFLDVAALDDQKAPPDFLSHSHGEGFLRFFDERTRRQGLFIFDEPESALSPTRQLEFMKLLWRMENKHGCQVIIATHAPMLMAYPGAALLRLTPFGLEPVDTQTEHFRLLKEFFLDPHGFVEMMLT